MGKTKETTMPKFLKLVKGSMWFDIDGEDASGVMLIAGTTQLTSRSTKDIDFDNKLAPLPTPPKDKFNNESTVDGQYGYVEVKDDKSFFELDLIPVNKQKNILNAYQAGILVDYDPSKPFTDEEKQIPRNNFEVNKDGDMVFIGSNEEMYKRLNTFTFDEIIRFIDKCDRHSRANLLDLLDYEKRGYNPLNRPRGEVMDLIRSKLNSFGPGITPITVNDVLDKD